MPEKENKKPYTDKVGRKLARKKLKYEDFAKLFTKEQMEVFAAGCRVEYGTAEPVDCATVARYERKLSEKPGDGSNPRD